MLCWCLWKELSMIKTLSRSRLAISNQFYVTSEIKQGSSFQDSFTNTVIKHGPVDRRWLGRLRKKGTRTESTVLPVWWTMFFFTVQQKTNPAICLANAARLWALTKFRQDLIRRSKTSTLIAATQSSDAKMPIRSLNGYVMCNDDRVIYNKVCSTLIWSQENLSASFGKSTSSKSTSQGHETWRTVNCSLCKHNDAHIYI